MGGMHLVFLGLSLSSSWGNGHATTYRALLNALARRGHDILFLERERSWYADNRDLRRPGFCRLVLYPDLRSLRAHRAEIAAADAVIVGSYVPDGIEAGRWVQRVAQGVKAFYDIDTPVTLAQLERGDCSYLSRDLVPGYDLYLSFTGGPTLRRLARQFGAPVARARVTASFTQSWIGASFTWHIRQISSFSTLCSNSVWPFAVTTRMVPLSGALNVLSWEPYSSAACAINPTFGTLPIVRGSKAPFFLQNSMISL